MKKIFSQIFLLFFLIYISNQLNYGMITIDNNEEKSITDDISTSDEDYRSFIYVKNGTCKMNNIKLTKKDNPSKEKQVFYYNIWIEGNNTKTEIKNSEIHTEGYNTRSIHNLKNANTNIENTEIYTYNNKSVNIYLKKGTIKTAKNVTLVSYGNESKLLVVNDKGNFYGENIIMKVYSYKSRAIHYNGDCINIDNLTLYLLNNYTHGITTENGNQIKITNSKFYSKGYHSYFISNYIHNFQLQDTYLEHYSNVGIGNVGNFNGNNLIIKNFGENSCAIRNGGEFQGKNISIYSSDYAKSLDLYGGRININDINVENDNYGLSVGGDCNSNIYNLNYKIIRGENEAFISAYSQCQFYCNNCQFISYSKNISLFISYSSTKITLDNINYESISSFIGNVNDNSNVKITNSNLINNNNMYSFYLNKYSDFYLNYNISCSLVIENTTITSNYYNNSYPFFKIYKINSTVEIKNSIITFNNNNNVLFLVNGTKQFDTIFNLTIESNLDGNIILDKYSKLNLELKSKTYNGAINMKNESKFVNITIDKNAVWNLTGNSYVDVLENNGKINYNNYKIYMKSESENKYLTIILYVGIGLVVLIALGILIFCCCKNKSSEKDKDDQVEQLVKDMED